jgi:hypothetical protein
LSIEYPDDLGISFGYLKGNSGRCQGRGKIQNSKIKLQTKSKIKNQKQGFHILILNLV